MLTITAAVVLTLTATVTPTFTPTPTTKPTMTLQEDRDYLFNELVKCGTMADKGIHDSYEAGWKQGVHDQFCTIQCNILKVRQNEVARWDNLAKEHNDDVWWANKAREYKIDLIETKKIIKKEKCDCSDYKNDN